MKLEIIIGGVLVAVLLAGGFLYQSSMKKLESKSNTVSSVERVAPVVQEEGEKAPVVNPGAPLVGEVAKKSTPPAPVQKFLTDAEKKNKFLVAPDISSPDGFVNTEGKPITLAELKGKKVVLLDIWTYSCINCQRTIPRLNDLYAKYKDQGLEIVGLHTPEFAFEKVQKNVENAVTRFDIKYPVVLDNDFSTWNAYGNRYWPRKYLIDIDGYIVYDHIGEGGYEDTERAVQAALMERSKRLGVAVAMATPTSHLATDDAGDASKVRSPEIYFGSARNNEFANGEKLTSGLQQLTVPAKIELNKLYLGGAWTMSSEYAENSGGGSIVFKYSAKNVHMVASSAQGADMEVWLDGKLLSTIHVQGELLYDVVKGKDYGEHTLELKVKSPGMRAFTFTFG